MADGGVGLRMLYEFSARMSSKLVRHIVAEPDSSLSKVFVAKYGKVHRKEVISDKIYCFSEMERIF